MMKKKKGLILMYCLLGRLGAGWQDESFACPVVCIAPVLRCYSDAWSLSNDCKVTRKKQKNTRRPGSWNRSRNTHCKGKKGVRRHPYSIQLNRKVRYNSPDLQVLRITFRQISDLEACCRSCSTCLFPATIALTDTYCIYTRIYIYLY
jgi:hypothetical protein